MKEDKINKTDPVDQIPSRIKYYLLDWKDRNSEEYFEKHGSSRLRDLNHTELLILFQYATIKDTSDLLTNLPK